MQTTTTAMTAPTTSHLPADQATPATDHATPATDQPDNGEALPTIPTDTLTAPVRLYSRATEPTTPPATRRWLEATLLAG
jgi:hypothetical protein